MRRFSTVVLKEVLGSNKSMIGVSKPHLPINHETRRTSRSKRDVSSAVDSKESLIDQVSSFFSSLSCNQDEFNLANMKEKLTFFSNQGLRNPVKDLGDVIASNLPLCPSPEHLENVIDVLGTLGKLQIYNQQLFEYALKFSDQLSTQQLSVAIYEGGRHGLRSKHLITGFVAEAKRRSYKDFTISDLLLVYRGLAKYSKEHTSVILDTKNSVFQEISRSPGSIKLIDLAVLFKIAKELKTKSFTRELVNKLLSSSKNLTHWLQISTLSEFDSFLLLLSSCEKLSDSSVDEVQDFLEICKPRLIENLNQNVAGCDIVGLIDTFYTFSSWGLWQEKEDSDAISLILERIISEKSAIKYSTNVGLWVLVCKSLSNVYRGNSSSSTLLPVCKEWLNTVVEFSRDPWMMERITPIQKEEIQKLLLSFKVFDDEVYSYFTNVHMANKEVRNSSSEWLAQIYSVGDLKGYRCEEKRKELMEKVEKVRDLESILSKRGIVNILYSKAVEISMRKDMMNLELEEKVLIKKLLQSLGRGDRHKSERDQLVFAFYVNGQERQDLLKKYAREKEVKELRAKDRDFFRDGEKLMPSTGDNLIIGKLSGAEKIVTSSCIH
jgi:hypothetical protein